VWLVYWRLGKRPAAFLAWILNDSKMVPVAPPDMMLAAGAVGGGAHGGPRNALLDVGGGDGEPYQAQALTAVARHIPPLTRAMRRRARLCRRCPAEFTDLLRAQPLSTPGNPPAWFARRGGHQWVVKGPCAADFIAQCVQSQAMKELLGVPHPSLRAEGAYLVQRCLLPDYTVLPTRRVTTALEYGLTVPDWASAGPGLATSWRDDRLATGDATALSMLLALLFRRIVGANDTLPSNLVVAGETVYSIDDAARWSLQQKYMWKHAAPPVYDAALRRLWPAVVDAAGRWRGAIAGAPAWLGAASRDFSVAMLDAHLAGPEAWAWGPAPPAGNSHEKDEGASPSSEEEDQEGGGGR
jgi:hypothetical protein